MSGDRVLYHYTSAEGLLGLVGSPTSNAKLWMTQIQYLNDAEEARHAYKLTVNELRRLEQTCPNVKMSAAGILGVPHGNEQWREADGFAVARDCTFSLSEEGDLLSQWRGYAPFGGYSIGYREADLNAFAAAQGLRLARCIYEESEQREIVEKSLLAIEKGFTSGEIDQPLQGVPEHDLVRATASVRFQKLGHRLAPIFKHPSFAEEMEWRLIGNIGVNDPRARWRAKGHSIVPYAEIEVGHSARPPLRPARVIIGPGVDYELAINSISYLTFNDSSKPELVRSQSTLRR